MSIYRRLSKILTTTFIKQLANMNQHKTLLNLSSDHKYVEKVITSHDYKKLFNRTYKILLENYRCEYIYKSEIYAKIRKDYKKHSDWGVLTEVRSDDSIADLVFLNGNSIAYEIKTEMDTNQRLSQQITSYSKLFNQTCVVTYENNIESVLQYVPTHTGIVILNESNQLHTIREPQTFNEMLDHRAMFNTLRKPEYQKLIKQAYGSVPNVPNTKIYEVCLNLFKELEVEVAQELMKEQLKERALKVNSFSYDFPKSMKLLIENGKLKKSELQSITELIL